MPLDEIAKRFGTTRFTVIAAAKTLNLPQRSHPGLRLSDATDAEAVAMRRGGALRTDIARELSVNLSTIYGRTRRAIEER